MIEIVAYDPTWPMSFAAEAERIRASFGAQSERIEHDLDELGYPHFHLGDFDLVYPFFKRPVRATLHEGPAWR